MTASLYAIRSVDTNLYMPERKSSRGYTTIEPEEFHPSRPRLFWTLTGACKALKAWQKGCWSKERGYQDSFTGEWDIDVSEPPKIAPDNRAGEYVIVEFTLEERV